MNASHALHDPRLHPGRMLPKNLWLAAPFVVLAIAVTSFTVTPLWIQHRAAELREPAHAALASSVQALGTLIEMRGRQRQAIAAARNGLDAKAERAARQRLASLTDEVAAEERRAIAASARLEEIRSRSLELANRLNLAWTVLAILGGCVAALLVRRHQRLTENVRRLDRDRAHELEQFAGRVAHDIVSPLGPVSVGVQYLARRLPNDAEAQGAVRIVRASLDRVGAIVDELLRFARAGARPAFGECADLPPIIDALRDELLPAARQQGVSLTLEPAPAVKVACSEAAILVVLQNLLRNAIKYIGDGPRKLVRARAAVDAGKIRLTVQDSGPGIPSGMESAVFEPYVRGEGTRQAGIGLGLATVKRIVESRRGRVGVCSDPRKGATFWVELPLAVADPAAG
jgi:signal transduction histidine kinase